MAVAEDAGAVACCYASGSCGEQSSRTCTVFNMHGHLSYHEAPPVNLLAWMQVPGQTHSFVQHIQLGVETAAADPQALLLFSGGKTRR